MIVDTVAVVAAIIAVVQAIKSVAPGVSGIITVLVAALLGLLFGYLHVAGLDVVSGLVLGLSAVGVHTVATVVGGTKSA